MRLIFNGSKVTAGAFASAPVSDSEMLDQLAEAMLEQEPFYIDEEGVIHQGDTISGSGNGTKISEGTFAASSAPNVKKASAEHPDQWYAKNPMLFRVEAANMQKRHPKAKFGFMPDSGDMYWVIELKVGDFCKPWQFMLRYMKDHPNNNDYGGSIRVLLMKQPSMKELEERAKAAGRGGVPHLLLGINSDGKEYTYLCTRNSSDVKDGVSEITSAVQVTAWAADWALHFEVALHNKQVWNEWCDDAHFRHLMLP